MHRYINLNDLIRRGKNIDWKMSIGCKCYFEYKEVNGYIKIVGINPMNRKIVIEYKDKMFEIASSSLLNVNLGKLLNFYTDEFKVEIGENIHDEYKNITIVSREYRKTKSNHNRKYYKYKCHNCGWDEGWMNESHLNCRGCSCCSNRTTVKGINDIATTDPWMIEYLVDKEDAYKYTSKSHKKVKVKCPDCGRVRDKKMTINTLYYGGLSCSKCGDGFSYPEKFMYNVLNQSGLVFESQYSPDWTNDKRYDFYIVNEKLILEVHGGQHYLDTGLGKGLEWQQEIDKIKRELALENGISNYIELDCRYSDKEFIKNSILNSELTRYFDFSDIDWDECNKYAMGNLVKDVCQYYNEHKSDLHAIGRVFNLKTCTVRNYLNRGFKLGLCEYTPNGSYGDMKKIINYYNDHKDMLYKDIAKNLNISIYKLYRILIKGSELGLCNYDKRDSYGRSNSKVCRAIKCIETDETFYSIRDCERKLKHLYGGMLKSDGIYYALINNEGSYKGLHFKYIDE